MIFNFKPFLCVLFLTIVLLLSQEVKAQEFDTLIVEWAYGESFVDALRTAIESDTPHVTNRVYKLRKGGFYWVTETITNNGWPLRIVGETPDPADPAGFPAVIQRSARTDGSFTGRLISGGGDITLKNVYIINSTSTGIQTDYQPIQIDATNSRFVFDNCVFERTNFAAVAFTGSGNDIFFYNNVFRNQIEKPVTLQWAGRGISIWADQDTVIVENNTFFNIGMTAFQHETGIANYCRFSHNTLVCVGRGMFATPWLRDAYVVDNLLINPFWHSEGYNDLHGTGRDPRSTYTGIFGFGALPPKYGTETFRKVLFAKNAAWRDPHFTTLYGDSLPQQWFVNRVLQEDYIDPLENVVIRDTTWLSERPNFVNGYDAVTTAQMDTMFASITSVRNNLSWKPTYFMNLIIDSGVGDTCYTCPKWPLEDFTYSTPSNLLTAGYMGLPLGNLNYFPDKKAEFEANIFAYYWLLYNEFGGGEPPPIAYDFEAEAGTLDGTSKVVAFTGNAWYTITGGTNVQWTFNSAYSGPIDMVVKARPDGGNIGFDFILNGKNYVDVARGWGQFVFWTAADDPQTFWTGKITTQFYEPTYLNAEVKEVDNKGTPFAVVAGTDTIKLQYSWNSVSFARINLYEAGTQNLIARLIPADAVNNGATPGGVGTWIPTGFKYVALNALGSITWNIKPWLDADYKIRLFYQNYKDPQTVQIAVDGTTIFSPELPFTDDSTGLDFLSSMFELTAGLHTLTITGSEINVDFIQLIPIIVSVPEEKGSLHSFALEQNYPNPFNPNTKISWQLPVRSHVTLKVYDLLGSEVASLVNGEKEAGHHSIDFNGSDLPSGVYFYTITAGNFHLTRKMLLVR